jgi:hypothetical protein
VYRYLHHRFDIKSLMEQEETDGNKKNRIIGCIFIVCSRRRRR